MTPGVIAGPSILMLIPLKEQTRTEKHSAGKKHLHAPDKRDRIIRVMSSQKRKSSYGLLAVFGLQRSDKDEGTGPWTRKNWNPDQTVFCSLCYQYGCRSAVQYRRSDIHRLESGGGLRQRGNKYCLSVYCIYSVLHSAWETKKRRTGSSGMV